MVSYFLDTAYCLNACNKKWYEYDDDIVRETTSALIQVCIPYENQMMIGQEEYFIMYWNNKAECKIY